MKVAVRIAQSAELHRVVIAYDTWGYAGGIKPDDTAWIAEIEDELIGIVRVAPENGILVLRGMRIAEQWRRRGIGTRMLGAVSEWLGYQECYCLPHAHLTEFYGQAGFIEVTPTAVPSFLAARLAKYKQHGLDVTIMVRPASA